MPGSDFASHDPDFTPEQEAQCARIVDGLRKINTRIVRLGGPLESLKSAADRVEALLASLDEVTESRALVTYKFPFDLDAPNDILRFNPATGRYNPVAPQLEMDVAGEKLVIRCEFPNCYESAPETVQGGVVAAVYDQLLAYAIMVQGFTGPTLWIKISLPEAHAHQRSASLRGLRRRNRRQEVLGQGRVPSGGREDHRSRGDDPGLLRAPRDGRNR